MGEGVDVMHGVVEAPPLVLVDEECRRVPPCPGEELAERLGRVPEEPVVGVVDPAVHQFEELAGTGDLCAGLFVAE